MPYVITTTTPDHADPDDLYRELLSATVTVLAVATLDEAQQAVYAVTCSTCSPSLAARSARSRTAP